MGKKTQNKKTIYTLKEIEILYDKWTDGGWALKRKKYARYTKFIDFIEWIKKQ